MAACLGSGSTSWIHKPSGWLAAALMTMRSAEKVHVGGGGLGSRVGWPAPTGRTPRSRASIALIISSPRPVPFQSTPSEASRRIYELRRLRLHEDPTRDEDHRGNGHGSVQ